MTPDELFESEQRALREAFEALQATKRELVNGIADDAYGVLTKFSDGHGGEQGCTCERHRTLPLSSDDWTAVNNTISTIANSLPELLTAATRAASLVGTYNGKPLTEVSLSVLTEETAARHAMTVGLSIIIAHLELVREGRTKDAMAHYSNIQQRIRTRIEHALLNRTPAANQKAC